ncbi:hypothetical protein [Ensifer sp. M14]|nr:hypothetical protein [Ensifer sp. M14]
MVMTIAVAPVTAGRRAVLDELPLERKTITVALFQAAVFHL